MDSEIEFGDKNALAVVRDIFVLAKVFHCLTVQHLAGFKFSKGRQ